MKTSDEIPRSIFLLDVHHAYAQTDGTYAWPNSREGDMLRQGMKEVEHLRAELAAAIKQRDDAHAQLRAEAALIAECRGGRWTAKSVAKERGWKCFKKAGGA